MGLLDILQQYAGGGSLAPQGDVGDHFNQVATQVPQQSLGNAIGAAFRSDATPAFGQMVGSLFGNSNPQQQAGLLNQLIPAMGGGALSSVAGGILGRVLRGSNPGMVHRDKRRSFHPATSARSRSTHRRRILRSWTASGTSMPSTRHW